MPGLSITNLPWPEKPYRIDLHSPGFESRNLAAAEDAKRPKNLRKSAQSRKGKRAKQARDLADRVDPVLHPETPETPASARYMREQRIRIIGAVWKLVAFDQTGIVVRFDVIKPKWAHKRKAFRQSSATAIRAEFRADIRRAAAKLYPSGAAGCEGFVFAALHGDHEVVGKLYQPHFHIVATGDWVAVVDELRKQRGYRPTKRVKRPIRARRKLTDMAYALTYLLKSYWPGKWQGYVSRKGTVRRRRKHGRIPEPHHSEVLLWLDRTTLPDLTLLMGIQITKEGLVPTK